MCIASFYSDLSGKAVFTFTRDERADRTFSDPQWINDRILAPIDLEAGGTWIGYNGECILSLQNGGTQKHVRDLPYDISRGKLLLDLLENKDWHEFESTLKANKIEPFTITGVDLISLELTLYIYEDRVLKVEKIGKVNKFINCSSTLYSNSYKSEIKDKFEKLAIDNESDIWNFHIEHSIGSLNNPLLKPSSTSLSQFILSESKYMKFENLNNSKSIIISLE